MISKCTLRQSASAAAKIVCTPTKYFITHDTTIYYLSQRRNGVIMKILVTGGAGYIGSHTCVELLNEGYEVVIMDNLYNANIKAVERIEQITGKKVTFYQTDMLDREGVKAIFDNEKIDAVIHFAGLKAVGESVVKPI